MHPLCEGHPRVLGVSAGARFVARRPRLQPEPVLAGGSFVDASGCSIYGSVLRDGGRFRMWYQAWPADFDGRDSCAVACVDSDDGLTWQRPAHGLIERHGSRANALTDLPFHSPSVFVDPHAGAARRYRAFGYTDPARVAALGYRVPDGARGYYTAHSADGIAWTVEPGPLWPHADVVTAAWDRWAGDGGAARVAFKHNGLSAGLLRRRFYTSQWRDGVVAPPVSAFVADDGDDLAAHARGALSADYYGVSWVPTPGPTVAVAWVFRHQAPLSRLEARHWTYGSVGQVDLELRVQLERGGRWLHLPGRPDWCPAAEAPPWARGALYGAAQALDVGDETWLYVTGTPERHGWAGAGVDLDAWRAGLVGEGGFARIGLLTWPRHRLLGVRADLREHVDLAAAPASADEPEGLTVEAETTPAGGLRVALLDGDYNPLEGYGLADCDASGGDLRAHRVTWRGSAALPPAARARQLLARVEVEAGTLWAFRFARPEPPTR